MFIHTPEGDANKKNLKRQINVNNFFSFCWNIEGNISTSKSLLRSQWLVYSKGESEKANGFTSSGYFAMDIKLPVSDV